jgi:hypothetical protein
MKQMKPEQINELFNILLDDDFDINRFKGLDFSNQDEPASEVPI